MNHLDLHPVDRKRPVIIVNDPDCPPDILERASCGFDWYAVCNADGQRVSWPRHRQVAHVLRCSDQTVFSLRDLAIHYRDNTPPEQMDDVMIVPVACTLKESGDNEPAQPDEPEHKTLFACPCVQVFCACAPYSSMRPAFVIYGNRSAATCMTIVSHEFEPRMMIGVLNNLIDEMDFSEDGLVTTTSALVSAGHDTEGNREKRHYILYHQADSHSVVWYAYRIDPAIVAHAMRVHLQPDPPRP